MDYVFNHLKMLLFGYFLPLLFNSKWLIVQAIRGSIGSFVTIYEIISIHVWRTYHQWTYTSIRIWRILWWIICDIFSKSLLELQVKYNQLSIDSAFYLNRIWDTAST